MHKAKEKPVKIKPLWCFNKHNTKDVLGGGVNVQLHAFLISLQTEMSCHITNTKESGLAPELVSVLWNRNILGFVRN
jgi:hypothetical protein